MEMLRGSDNWSGEDYTNGEQWTGIHRHHYVMGILLQIQRKIKLIDNWSNKQVGIAKHRDIRHRIQRSRS